MPSTFRRFAPMFILIMIAWSFLVNFMLGLILLSTLVISAICIYQISVKQWQNLIEDDFLNLDLEEEVGSPFSSYHLK